MLNPVKTKLIVITTRQRHHISDLSLSLSVDGQNIDNVTKHRLLGLTVDKKFRWQVPDRTHAKACLFLSFFFFFFLFLFQLQHVINTDTRKIFYNAHIKSYIDHASVMWGACGEVHLKNRTPYIEGQAN